MGEFLELAKGYRKVSLTPERNLPIIGESGEILVFSPSSNERWVGERKMEKWGCRTKAGGKER